MLSIKGPILKLLPSHPHCLQHHVFIKVILKDFTWLLPAEYFVWGVDLCLVWAFVSGSREAGGKRMRRFSRL